MRTAAGQGSVSRDGAAPRTALPGAIGDTLPEGRVGFLRIGGKSCVASRPASFRRSQNDNAYWHNYQQLYARGRRLLLALARLRSGADVASRQTGATIMRDGRAVRTVTPRPVQALHKGTRFRYGGYCHKPDVT